MRLYELFDYAEGVVFHQAKFSTEDTTDCEINVCCSSSQNVYFTIVE